MRPLLALFFLLTACAHSDTPIAMPEEMLGYWNPASKPKNIFGLEIRPNGKLEWRNDNNKKLDSEADYKIIRIEEDGTVLIITREKTQPLSPTATEEEYRSWPTFYNQYVSLRVEPDDGFTILYQSHLDQNLKEEEWSKPLSWHRAQTAEKKLPERGRTPYVR